MRGPATSSRFALTGSFSTSPEINYWRRSSQKTSRQSGVISAGLLIIAAFDWSNRAHTPPTGQCPDHHPEGPDAPTGGAVAAAQQQPGHSLPGEPVTARASSPKTLAQLTSWPLLPWPMAHVPSISIATVSGCSTVGMGASRLAGAESALGNGDGDLRTIHQRRLSSRNRGYSAADYCNRQIIDAQMVFHSP